MVRVEKTTGGTVYLQAVDDPVSVGDRLDVSTGLAAHLCESRGDFVRVDGDDGETESDSDDDEEADGFDVEAFLNRDPTDVDAVAEDILAGEADEHLDAIDEAAERVTVGDAVGERRAELEEE